MRRITTLLLSILVIAALTIVGHIIYLRNWTTKEIYPADHYLKEEPNKTALIIVAHDDDMVGTSGTISMLCKEGWAISELCFYQQGGLYAQKDSIKNPIRKQDFQTAAAIQGLKGIFPTDFNFRYDMNTEERYMPIPYAAFSKNYMVDSLTKYVAAYIEKYKPSVIFTLDNVMGGYGNPDHVLISRIILDYCIAHNTDPGFSVRKIYQPVFPPSLAEHALGKLPVYQKAKTVYNVSGMPLPDVQINISDYGRTKKAAMASYSTEQNSIKKIYPYYDWYPHWLYFKIFDREFFHVIDIKS